MTYLVSLTDFTDNVLLGNLDVVESELTGGRRLDTELKVSQAQMRSNHLLLLLGDLNTHVFGHDETGDTLVTGRRVDIGEYLSVSSVQ